MQEQLHADVDRIRREKDEEIANVTARASEAEASAAAARREADSLRKMLQEERERHRAEREELDKAHQADRARTLEEVSARAQILAGKMQEEVRTAMNRAAETEQSSQLQALDAATRAEERRRAFEKEVNVRTEAMVKRYR